MIIHVKYSSALTIVVLSVVITACGTDRDNPLVDDETWESYIEAGPLPDRDVQGTPLAPGAVADRLTRQQGAGEYLQESSPDKQILFGDTHVHTTFSLDAFSKATPVAAGMLGAFPPSDACDYARYISQLDFYFLTDHAKSYTPKTWDKAIETVRDCNRVAGDPENPDVVAYMGYEWTHVGSVAEQHYGHHNVLYRDTDHASLPPRPVSAIRFWQGTDERIVPKKLPLTLSLIDFKHRSFYREYNQFIEHMASIPLCPKGVHTKELPKKCLEYAENPTELYRKINEFGVEAIVIPHGMAWGNSAPPNATWDHYFEKGMINNHIVRLLEVYSGHGNSEQYRNFEARSFDEQGNVYCPEEQENYLPACQRAGQLIREWCLVEGLEEALCEQRAELARQYFVEEPTQLGWLVVPGSEPVDWLDAGQCRDCFLPAYDYRPKKSAQYGLARREFNVKQGDSRFLWGFVGSTDTHRAAAGHGFKQQHRLYTSDADGPATPFFKWLRNRKRGDRDSMPRKIEKEMVLSLGAANRDQERLTSFLTLGGLAAVHSEGRNREAIWDGLKRRETYATSGHRTLLWFDLISEEEAIPMGGRIETATLPRFRASAVGSLKQLPGCPEHVKTRVSEDILMRLSLGECYNPSDERLRITRIEVIRIRPQAYENEPVEGLIEDVWRSFACEDAGTGCVVEFDDPEFVGAGRDSIYYVRAIEEATPTVNGGNLRTTYNQQGKAVEIDPCYGGYRTDPTDDCLSNTEHRAWSSPIFVDFGASIPKRQSTDDLVAP